MSIVHLKERILDPSDTRNLVVDGAAGTGKSTLIRELKEIFGDLCCVTAISGIASLIVKGKTISSTCKLGLYDLEEHEIIENNSLNEVLSRIEKLILDEVSMQRLEELHQVHLACQSAKQCYDKPFGGIQVILFGDQAQLRPIIQEGNHMVSCNNVFDSFKNGNLKELNFDWFTLTHIYRQKDQYSKDRLTTLRELIIDQNYDISFIDTLFKELRKNENQQGITLYSNVKALPKKNIEIEDFYYPENKKGKAPYDQLPLISYGEYLITSNFRSFGDKYINGQTIILEDIHDVYDYETEVFERIKVRYEEEEMDENGKVRLVEKLRTENGDLLHRYVPFMVLNDATTRRVQGSTFHAGSIAYEFFQKNNRVRRVSLDGWFRTLYVALSRFESLKYVSIRFPESVGPERIESKVRRINNESYQIVFTKEDTGRYRFEVYKDGTIDTFATDQVHRITNNKYILHKFVMRAVDGIFDKLDSIVLEKTLYLMKAPRGDMRIKTAHEKNRVISKEGWKIMSTGDLDTLQLALEWA